MRARSLWSGVALSLALVVPACGDDDGGGASATTEATTVEVYLTKGERLAAVERAVPATADELRASLEQLLAGPTEGERGGGYATTVPQGTALLGVTLDRGVATVDLSGEFASGGGSLSMLLRIAQVVYTATEHAGVDAVLFRLDGEPVEAIGGEGIMVAEPQTRAMYEDLAP